MSRRSDAATQRRSLQRNRGQRGAQFVRDFTGQLALALQRVLLLTHQLVDGHHHRVELPVRVAGQQHQVKHLAAQRRPGRSNAVGHVRRVAALLQVQLQASGNANVIFYYQDSDGALSGLCWPRGAVPSASVGH